MEKEFRQACGFFGNPLDALEEWDLLNDEIQMKIEAEYNSLIDIELPPPQRSKDRHQHREHRGSYPHQRAAARRSAASEARTLRLQQVHHRPAA